MAAVSLIAQEILDGTFYWGVWGSRRLEPLNFVPATAKLSVGIETVVGSGARSVCCTVLSLDCVLIREKPPLHLSKSTRKPCKG